MLRLLAEIYVGKRFLVWLAVILVLFILAAIFHFLLPLAVVVLAASAIWMIFDIFMLFLPSKPIRAEREIPDKLSNGDRNIIDLSVTNQYRFPVLLKIYDEVPIQFQVRTGPIISEQEAGEVFNKKVGLIPVERGVYSFGRLNVYATRKWGLFERRFRFSLEKDVPVYPSFLKLRQYELEAFGSNRRDPVMAQRSKIGASMEFEQIKKYVQGDPERWINWKATARRSELMVNQYAEEQSKDVYCLIDTSRYMLMPFDGMTLMDYAINASLALSHIALKSGDRVGTIVFGRKVKRSLRSKKGNAQLHRIMELLYSLDTEETEPDYSLLNAHLRRQVQHRSLMILFTNFEVEDDFIRKVPELRLLNRYHHLVVVFFRNTELETLSAKPADSNKGIYRQAVAESLVMDKEKIVNRLRKLGIAAVLTKPHDISTKAIQAYLDMKRKKGG